VVRCISKRLEHEIMRKESAGRNSEDCNFGLAQTQTVAVLRRLEFRIEDMESLHCRQVCVTFSSSASGLFSPLKGPYRPLKSLIRPFKGLIRPLKNLIRPLKSLISPLKSLIRPFKGLIRPLKRPYKAL
jgi:hypothetical protein